MVRAPTANCGSKQASPIRHASLCPSYSFAVSREYARGTRFVPSPTTLCGGSTPGRVAMGGRTVEGTAATACCWTRSSAVSPPAPEPIRGWKADPRSPPVRAERGLNPTDTNLLLSRQQSSVPSSASRRSSGKHQPPPPRYTVVRTSAGQGRANTSRSKNRDP